MPHSKCMIRMKHRIDAGNDRTMRRSTRIILTFISHTHISCRLLVSWTAGPIRGPVPHDHKGDEGFPP